MMLLLVIYAGRVIAADDGFSLLANTKLKVIISNTGKLLSVENVLAGEKYSFASDEFELDTDLGLFSNRDTKPTSVKTGPRRVVYRFDFDKVGVSLIYTLKGENSFFRRSVKVENKGSLRVKNLVLGRTKFVRPSKETVHYTTFIAAPTVNFIRYETGGLFSGIENPYFNTEMNDKGMALAFEPALILKPGEGYQSEPQFIGVYKKSGVMVADSGRAFRYNANASGYKPLDRNETRAMRAYALDYLAPAQKQFLNVNYQFFHPLPQMPRNAAAADYFYKTIDTFSEIGGDMIIFKPLHPYRKPSKDQAYWNVIPDDKNHTAAKICEYAAKKGIRYGFYMGCAAHGGEGNAAGLNFRPDKPQWKKTDAKGNRALDNCMGCDEFFQWWLTVHDNTIKKYKLINWSWDPSLGSGMNCHDESHGHFANKGGYKGWRRCIELMARLKAETPGLFIQGFYGTKNFGLWGLKHVDQHEVYNEQTIIVSTKHKQISDDRQQADALRFQNNWSMRFRFTPAVTSHALVHRISEGGFRPDLIKAWDYNGWKYSVMSSLAIAGSFMPTIMPYETRLVPGYADFYKKWSKWAKDNFEYVNHTEPFGSQVVCGAVDGYSRIKGDHGFVFLFNGNPRSAEIAFEVGDEINLQADGTYQFTELYPSEKGRLLLDSNGKSTFARGASARVIVPANSCLLLELKRTKKRAGLVLAGIEGQAVQKGTAIEITGVSGKPGAVVEFDIQLSGAKKIRTLTANGVDQKFTATDNAITGAIGFAGRKYQRELDQWRTPDGSSFSFPLHEARKNLTLKSSFHLQTQVAKLLAGAKPANFEEMGAKVESWYKAGNKPNDLSYHNFIGCRPERLWLIVPVYRRSGCRITLNGKVVTNQMIDRASDWIHADITDLVTFGADNSIELHLPNTAVNNFMGPFLIYPEEPSTTRISPEPQKTPAPVVYTKPLDPTPPLRYRKDVGPVVLAAKMLGKVKIVGNRRAEFEVKLADYPAGIKKVMFFESGFGWMGQHGIGYDGRAKVWRGTVTPGSRWRIQEHEFIYIWAEGKDGLRSEYYPLKVDWNFSNKAPRTLAVAGAIEAESLKIVSKTRGRVVPQNMTRYGNHWSSASQLVWWGGLKKNDQLVLEFTVKKAGSYGLQLHLSRAHDYGTFSFQLDDGPASEAIDIYDPRLQKPMPFKLKSAKLSKGAHRLKIKYHRKNPKSTNSLIGIDYLMLKAVD
jgi:hypothetical protein